MCLSSIEAPCYFLLFLSHNFSTYLLIWLFLSSFFHSLLQRKRVILLVLFQVLQLAIFAPECSCSYLTDLVLIWEFCAFLKLNSLLKILYEACFLYLNSRGYISQAQAAFLSNKQQGLKQPQDLLEEERTTFKTQRNLRMSYEDDLW